MDFKVFSIFLILMFGYNSKGRQCSKCRDDNEIYCREAGIKSLHRIANLTRKFDAVERLELEGNEIKFSDNRTGLEMFKNLKAVILKNNKISSIPAKLFKDNPKLEELNLAGNLIRNIPVDLFRHTPKLRLLMLDNNKLTSLPSDLFNKTSDVRALVLSNNKISALPPILFEKARNVEILIINNNDISNLSVGLFKKMKNLETLKVENNKLPFFNPEFFTLTPLLGTFSSSGYSDCCNARRRIKNIQCKGKDNCDVRVQAPGSYMGRVEINDRTGWKTLCDNDWTKKDADVVCRELGFDGAVEPIRPKYVEDGSGEIWPFELNCGGQEYSRKACARKKIGVCSHKSDVGVRCQKPETNAGKLCTVMAKVIDCSQRGLEHVPWMKKNLEKIVERFDLSTNKIKWIFGGALTTLTKLKTFDISSNRIEEIPEKLLSNSTAIESINFAKNKISVIPRMLLRITAPNLTKIDLSENELTEIPRGAFFQIKTLKTLILKGNRFKNLYPYYFKGLENLELLDVSEMDMLVDLDDTKWRPMLDELPRLKILSTGYFRHCCFVGLIRPGVECKAPADTFSSCDQMLKSDALRYLMWTLVVLTFGGNLFSLFMRLVERDSNKVQNLFVCSLSISDMLMGVYLVGIIYQEIATRGKYYRYDLKWRSGNGCKVYGAISVISSEVSVFTLIFIAYDRFLQINHALKFKKISWNTAIISLISVWVSCIVIAILPAIIKSYFFNSEKDTGFYGTSSICMPLQLGDKTTAWEYSIAVFGVVNFMAAIYLIVAYIQMFYSSYRSARESGSTDRVKKNTVLAKRFAAVVFTDVCCWFPIGMLLFLSLGKAVSDDQNVLYAWFSICVIPINSAINPILYTISTPVFWTRIKTYFKKNICRCNAGSEEMSEVTIQQTL